MKNLVKDLLPTVLLCFISNTVNGSFKKGISVNPNNFLCDDLKVLDKVTWWYDWGANLDIIRQKSGCLNVDQHVEQHVPMAWGYGSYFQRYYLNEEAEFLLGFNEPNHKGQSDILAEDAAKYWPEVEKLADGRPLVSPSAAPCGGSNCNGNTKEWFDLFFKHCNGCRIDYLATHVYNCDVDKTMNFLEDLYNTYNLSIWLTEFACPYKTNPKTQLRYMQQLLPKLEEADYIFRYAWFVSRVTEITATRFIPTSVSLFEANSSTLTPLGEFYNSFTTTEPTSRITGLTKTTFGKTTAIKTTATTTSTLSTTTSSTTSKKDSVTTTDASHSNTTTRMYTNGGSFINSAINMKPGEILTLSIFISALVFLDLLGML